MAIHAHSPTEANPPNYAWQPKKKDRKKKEEERGVKRIKNKINKASPVGVGEEESHSVRGLSAGGQDVLEPAPPPFPHVPQLQLHQHNHLGAHQLRRGGGSCDRHVTIM